MDSQTTLTATDTPQTNAPQTDASQIDSIAPDTALAITEPSVVQYFETFNADNFDATANLFAVDGALHAPFESPIVGREAIAAYLEKEAKGMCLEPLQAVSQVLETGETEVKVSGKVQTPLFGVNVTWTFLLNERSEIVMAGIKLLAALEDLLKLKQ